ncbi:MAG: zf-HC2 domain-containing protein [candidate division WOR-3 bacterium]
MEHCSDEVLSRFLDGELDGVEYDWVERHLAECSWCRESLEELRLIVETAAQAERPEPSPSMWLAIERRIQGVKGSRAGVWPWAWLGAGAVVAVLVLAVLLWGRRPVLVEPVRVPVAARSVARDAREEGFKEPRVQGLKNPRARGCEKQMVQVSEVKSEGATGQDGLFASDYEQFFQELSRALEESERARRENPGNLRVRAAYAGFRSGELTSLDRLVAGGD